MVNWGSLATIAGSAIGGLLGDGGDDGDRTTTTSATVNPRTVSGGQMQDFDILYSQQAVEQMQELTKRIEEWSTTDRDFFTNTYQPFQENIVRTNEALLPAIEQVAGATLEQNARDMQSNEGLKSMLRDQAGAAGEGQVESLQRFMTELDNIPSEEERVGQALTRVEGQFTQAGKQLARDFQSRGQTVSQASQRGLAIEKAKAKAGAAGVAAESSRTERLAAAERGVGVTGSVQAGATSQLLGVQAGQQAGLATPQVGGLKETTGLESATLEAGLATTQATQELGTRTRADSVEQTQAGIKNPVLTTGATGVAPPGTFSTGVAPVELDENGQPINPQ